MRKMITYNPKDGYVRQGRMTEKKLLALQKRAATLEEKIMKYEMEIECCKRKQEQVEAKWSKAQDEYDRIMEQIGGQ
jgi:hypothetical protein